MKSSVIVKAITLLGFFTLIVGFLFYRSGRFEDFFGSHNGGAITTSKSQKQDSTMQGRTMLPSSKVLIVTPASQKDTVKPLKTFQRKNKTTMNPLDRNRLSSSKSTIIFTPRDTVKSKKQ